MTMGERIELKTMDGIMHCGGNYHIHADGSGATLDGAFTFEELEALAKKVLELKQANCKHEHDKREEIVLEGAGMNFMRCTYCEKILY